MFDIGNFWVNSDCVGIPNACQTYAQVTEVLCLIKGSSETNYSKMAKIASRMLQILEFQISFGDWYLGIQVVKFMIRF